VHQTGDFLEQFFKKRSALSGNTVIFSASPEVFHSDEADLFLFDLLHP
jgi:hypothetical protein